MADEVSASRRRFLRGMAVAAAAPGVVGRCALCAAEAAPAAGAPAEGAAGPHAPTGEGAGLVAGVERIHWETTGCICFVGSVVACMHVLGEKVTNDYVMGISGGAFKLFWHPAWSPANCALPIYGEEPVRRTFASLGYDYACLGYFDGKDPAQMKELYRERIIESIDRGRPVIGFGIVGPPECCVIAGYEKGGEVLYGRSYFQEEARNYFRAENWSKGCAGLILIGEKKGQPEARRVLKDALEWAIKLARVPEFEGTAEVKGSRRHLSGLAAYDGIIAALERDADFPADDLDTLSFRCMALGNDGILLLGCKRVSAARFVTSMADQGHPGAGDLRNAAKAYTQEREVLESAGALTPWSGAPEAERRKIAGRERRLRIAALVREAKAAEELAVQCLEAAHAALV